MRHFSRLSIIVLISATMTLSACATDEYGRSRPMTDTEKGALFGALGGAVLGAVAGSKQNRNRNVLLGAIGGGIAGGLVGHYMDKQKKDFEKQLSAERDQGIIIIEQLPGDSLRVTMTAQSAFDVDSAQIKPSFNSTMDKISGIVNQYGKTTIDVVGHTDNTGSQQHNQELSERRAQSVAQYFLRKNVHQERLRIEGAGENQPRADNKSANGRAQNRRVEINIIPVVAQS